MERWQNQQEAYEFAMKNDACMLDMEMGTGSIKSLIVCLGLILMNSKDITFR